MKTENTHRSNFRKMLSLVMALCFSFFLFENANAGNNHSSAVKDTTAATYQFKNAINMCPGGIAFGIISMNYEHLFTPNHGLVFRLDYEGIPKTYSDANIESNGMAAIVNYRYHLCGGMKSSFVGAFSRFRIYQGEGSINSTDFDFDIPEVTLGLNIGKRWAWKSGFTMTFALGYGISKDWTNVNNSNADVETAIDDFKDDYDFINGFLGEFSIGYTF